MKVAVVGATGNVGTAVLRALRDSDEAEQIVGIARRLPEPAAQPYDVAEWHSVDLADPASSEALETAFNGAEAVIHLAWLIQPNRQRELMRTVNVDGTGRVLEAAARAGVRRIVVASSVGAYSPSRDSEPHDEWWPVQGIETSHYSVDKAAQEQLLQSFQQRHPDIDVAWLRTALVFQRGAGAEIQRLFLGPLAPTRLLGRVRIPLLPLPQGIRLQVVHADDAAQAYLLAAVRGASGAFNIAADDVLVAKDLAAAVRGMKVIEVRPAVLRAAMSAAYRARAIPADAGWLDMGMQVPVMDTSRAKRELGWKPRHSARHALDELIVGLREQLGTGSPALRGNDTSMPTTRPDPAN